jgi:hypothetical protein
MSAVAATRSDRIDLEARAAIADLIHRYARNIRYGDFAACTDLFTDEAFFEQRASDLACLSEAPVMARYEGRAAIVAYIGRGASAGGSVCPMIHNILIETTGDEAASSCVMTAFIAATEGFILGEYRDTFRHEGGAWRFASRTHTMLHNGASSTAPATR